MTHVSTMLGTRYFPSLLWPHRRPKFFDRSCRQGNRSPDRLRGVSNPLMGPPDAPRPGRAAGGAKVEASEKDLVHVTELSTPQLQRRLRIRG
jgi:hypothetical protein